MAITIFAKAKITKPFDLRNIYKSDTNGCELGLGNCSGC